MSLIVPIMKPVIGSSDPGAGSGGVTTLKHDLTSCWELDETSGTTAYDSHGNNDGRRISTATPGAPGKVGTAYDFTYNNSVVYTDIVTLPSYTTLSVFLWYRTETFTIPAALVSKWDSGRAINERTFFIQVIATGSFRAMVSLDGTTNNYKDYRDTVSVVDGEWHHIGFTFDNGTLKIFRDGIEVTPVKNVDDDVPTLYSGGSTDMLISCTQATRGIGQEANGYIDQVAMWSRALTAAEVAALYNSGNGLAYVNW